MGIARNPSTWGGRSSLVLHRALEVATPVCEGYAYMGHLVVVYGRAILAVAGGDVTAHGVIDLDGLVLVGPAPTADDRHGHLAWESLVHSAIEGDADGGVVEGAAAFLYPAGAAFDLHDQ